MPTDAFDPANPASYNGSTSTTVYDSLGNAHASTMYFRKSGANTWEQYQYIEHLVRIAKAKAVTKLEAT